MPISSHLSLSDLQSLYGVVKQSLAVKTHFDLFAWLQDDFQSFVPHATVIAAWGTFSLNMVSLDVVSPKAGLRTQMIDEESILPLVTELFRRWESGGQESYVIQAPHSLTVNAQSHEPLSLALAESRSVLVHGIKDQRGRHDCLYVLLGTEALSSQRTRELFPFLLPYVDIAFRQVAHLPEQYLEEYPRQDPPETGPSSDLAGASAGLSVREVEIMKLVRIGKTNYEIGMILDISAFTVKNHVQRIFKKLDVVNRAQAVAKIEGLRFNARGQASQ